MPDPDVDARNGNLHETDLRLSEKIAELEKERRALMLRIVVRTKHGPQGRGDNGPCDKDCLKCEAELFLRKT